MLLQEINTDILRDIASSLASSPNTTSIDILSLAQTCRSLYAVARHFVPSSLYLEIPSSKYQLLKRMLNENPTYGLGVRSLNIQASKTTQESTRTQVFEFLQKLPNLTTLFALDPKFSVRLASLILSPELQFRTSLQKLLLGDRDLTSRELLDITRLPHLQHLVVRLMTDLDDHKEDEQPPIQSSNSLQYLKLRGCQIRSQTLSNILSSANSLHTLSCTAALHGTITKSMLAGEISIAAKFSPEKILRCLMPVSRTLVKLDMHTNGQEWAGHDETRLNLSEFTALRSISASAEIFLPPLLLGISRDGLYRLLPPSLRNLKFTFGFSVGIFYDVTDQVLDAVGRDRFLDKTLDPVSYQWIVELALHKTECFPHLKSVSMWERTRERDSLFSNEEWKPPLDVSQVSKEANIELGVFVRCPKTQEDSS